MRVCTDQWLGYQTADPNNAHLSTMQAVFKAAIEGEPEECFRDQDQWVSYSKGLSLSEQEAHKAANIDQLSEEDMRGKSAEDFRRSVGPDTSWVWMDYISIPQTVSCKSEAEVQQALADQAAAIKSIPSYVAEVENFFICAPQDAMHVDLCQPCNYETWFDRGWCRLEETILMLTRAGDGRPLFVTQPVGAPPKLFTNDSIDRMWMHTQRHSSVLTGNYSCCRMGHKVTMPGGKQTVPIPCDKDRLRPVLEQVIDEQCATLRAKVESQIADGTKTLMQKLGKSFGEPGRPMFNYFSFNVLRGHILAEHKSETDEERAAWPKTVDGIAPEETARAYLDRFGVSLEVCAADAADTSHTFYAAVEGNLPMLRWLHEMAGKPLNLGNIFDMTALLISSRMGNIACVEYLCSKLPVEEINRTSKGLGLSALGDASKCGWPEVISVLLAAGASTEVTRKNGQTPLLEACVNGHVPCVKLLLEAGADCNAVDGEGKSAMQLAEQSAKGSAAIKELLKEYGASE